MSEAASRAATEHVDVSPEGSKYAWRAGVSDSDYVQLCCAEGLDVEVHEEKEVADAIKQDFGLQHDIRMVGCLLTFPKSEGGSDTFFFIHNDDIGTFAVKRFTIGGRFRWWEDVLNNGNARRYPDRFLDAYPPTW